MAAPSKTKTAATSQPQETNVGTTEARVVPAKKHPWLLALSLLVFCCWIGFLTWMALHG